MGDTLIEWTGKSINPIKAKRKSDGKKGWACVRVSPGCVHCYSEKQNEQCGNNPGRHGTGLPYTVPALEQVELYLDEDVLREPLHWRKPTKIFPCSMTDWCADFVPDEWRDKLLAVAALTPQHSWQFLTKRADNLLRYLNDEDRAYAIGAQLGNMLDGDWIWKEGKKFRKEIERLISLAHGFSDDGETQASEDLLPLPNVWVGVSVEDQPRSDERIPLLLQTQAALRWVSFEPLLEHIDLRGKDAQGSCLDSYEDDPKLDWGVIGLESGRDARPGYVNHVRSLLEQFQAAGAPCFVKQLGAKPHEHDGKNWPTSRIFLNDSKGGDMSEWPEYLRVREYPKVSS